ncbi:hypothetical protein P7C73_g2489, partial [Tremellales sp. Uapishka_1]
MTFLASMKTPMLGFLLVVSYCNMVIDIIQIIKIHTGEATYPPAVVSQLTCSICQMCFCLYVIAGGARKLSASIIAGVTGFFACWSFGSVTAFTVLRHHARYCGPNSVIRSDCNGVLRGTMGLGWIEFFVSLFYIAFLAVAVAKWGSWGSKLSHLPPPPMTSAEQDAEKAGLHGGH